MPFFSIVVPTLNRELELKRCVDSVLQQTFHDWELLIIDDGSKDNTEELILTYQEEDKRIKFIPRPIQRIQGGNTCRNIGIEEAQGQFVSFLDSDDAFGVDRLKNIYEFIHSTKNYEAFYSGAIKVFESCNRVSYPSIQIQASESIFDFIFSKNSFVSTITFVVKIELAQKVKFDENLRRHQDYDFFIRIGQHTLWKLINNTDVFIFTSNAGLKKIDFNSCVMFYDNHKKLSLDSDIRKRYLTYISESCVKINPSKRALRYYHQQFLEENWMLSKRQYLIFKFPFLFHYFYRLKLIIKGLVTRYNINA